MTLDLEKFKREAAAKKQTNRKFFQKLKKLKPKQLDAEIHELHEEAFSCIDCLACANCCKTTGPLFTNRDIDRLAKHLKLSPANFMEQYLRVDEEGDFVLQQLPCPFLGSDNYCSVYEARPKACRTYPHTDQNGQHTILNLTRKNAEICPAVDYIIEGLRSKNI